MPDLMVGIVQTIHGSSVAVLSMYTGRNKELSEKKRNEEM